MIKQEKAVKKWLRTNILIFLLLIGSIGSLNFFMDPLWCFKHKNFLQSHREGFEERQQKINLIYFQLFDYDGIMLGSSRVTVHNTETIQVAHIFNMAADGMRTYEFNEYIEYAKQANHRPFKYIILGLDFLSIEQSPQQYDIDPYIRNSESFMYRYKALFSYDSLKITVKNIKNTFFDRSKKRFKIYNQNHVAIAVPKDEQLVNEKISSYLLSVKNKKLHYDRKNYLQTLQQLKSNNQNTKFIVFTTPLPAPILQHLLQSKENQKVYTMWLQDIQTVFGPFYHFSYVNPIGENYQNYFVDEGHYISDVGNCINSKIMGQSCNDPIFDDFGVLVKKNDDLDIILY